MPAFRNSGASLMPLLLLLRQSQGLVLPCRQSQAVQVAAASISAAGRTRALLLRPSTAAAPVAATAVAASGRRVARWGQRRMAMEAAAGECGGGSMDDVRERAEAMHSVMPSEGKDEMLQQADRDAHNRRQAAVFNAKAEFFASPKATPPEQFPALRRIAETCRPDGEGNGPARVVDVGCGTGALVPFLKDAGVEEEDVVGVDMAAEMGSIFTERFPRATVVTSDFVDFADETMRIREKVRPPVAAASGDVDDVGPEEKEKRDEERKRKEVRSGVATVVFNAVFGNLWDQEAALERAAAVLEEGGKVVISHPLGRDFVSRLKAVDSTVVPHDLPEQDELERLVQFLPFQVDSFESGRDLYLAVLKKTPHRATEMVRYLRGEVSAGYGRGSKKLGVPTANLPESQFAENLRSLPTGVYFGWATLEDGREDSSVGEGGGPWKCVANVGYSPTFAGQENAEKIVEGHLIDYKTGDDFYGKTMRLLLAGFQRYEKKFASFPELVATINKDVADAAAALDEPRFSAFKGDDFFSPSREGSSIPEAWSTRDFLSASGKVAKG